MDYLDELNKILSDLLLRMEIKEKSKRVDCYCCIELTDKESYIISETNILQSFGYRLEFEATEDKHYPKLVW